MIYESFRLPVSIVCQLGNNSPEHTSIFLLPDTINGWVTFIAFFNLLLPWVYLD